jgi:hypothetical protein
VEGWPCGASQAETLPRLSIQTAAAWCRAIGIQSQSERRLAGAAAHEHQRRRSRGHWARYSCVRRGRRDRRSRLFNVTSPPHAEGKVALKRAGAGAVRCAGGQTRGTWFGRAARSRSDLMRVNCSPARRKRLRYSPPGLRSIRRPTGLVRKSTTIRHFRTKRVSRTLKEGSM